jgi:hypothetical protein
MILGQLPRARYAGRLPPTAADVALLPTDAQSRAWLEIVVGIAANEGNSMRSGNATSV